MGNSFWGPDRPDEPRQWVKLSNGGTSAFVSILAMAASAEAKSSSQRKIACALASRDQSIVGRGTAGFEVATLPWVDESFEDDRQFVIDAAMRAASGHDWDRLSYRPAGDVMSDAATQFAAIIGALQLDDIEVFNPGAWPLMPDQVEATCGEHDVLLHGRGCVVCNAE